MERVCQFCKKPASYAPLEEMESFNIKVFFCHPCQAEYLYFSKDNIISTTPSSVSLYADVNGKKYRWTMMSDGRVQLWHVKKPGIPGQKKNEEMEPVAHFIELETSSVTPQNIKSKLQSWLTFL